MYLLMCVALVFMFLLLFLLLVSSLWRQNIRARIQVHFISSTCMLCLDTRSARLQDEEWEGRENLREEDRKSVCESERAEGRLKLN